MMYRDVDILPSKTVGDSGTETVDIDVTDPITELEVLVGLTNGGAHVVGDLPTEIVSKIEIVDGGTVFASLSGPELAADFFYQSGKYPPHWYSEVLSQGQSVSLPMRFGRYLGDPTRSLDASKLRNPQIKITWAKDTLHLTNTVTLGVRAKIMADVPAAPSVLLTKAIRAFTTAGSGIEETELPTDYPIRRLYVGLNTVDDPPAYIITQLKLDCDEGKFVPFDLSGWAFGEEAEKAFGYCTVRRMMNLTNADHPQAFVANCLGSLLSSGAGAYIVSAVSSGNPSCLARIYLHDGTGGTNIECEGIFYGAQPHGVWAYEFGLPNDPATWLPANAFKKLKLKLTNARADFTCTILVQQDRPI